MVEGSYAVGSPLVSGNHVLVELYDTSVFSKPVKLSNRIKYTCISASQNYVAIGTTVGSIYMFEREHNELMQVIQADLHGHNIVKITLSPNQQYLAYATSIGSVVTVQHNSGCRMKFEQLNSSSLHTNSFVTCLTWSHFSDKVYIGDQNGLVSLLKATKEVFKSTIETLMRLDSEIVQIETNRNQILISTSIRSYLGNTTKQNFSIIGKKPRDGKQGACFFQPSSDVAPLVYCSRPGSRIWEVNETGTVLNTHQFKELLNIPKTETVTLHDPNFRFRMATKCDEQKVVNFGRLHVIRDKYLLTLCDYGLYIVSPANINPVMWSDKFNTHNVKDYAVFKNRIFVLQHDNFIQEFTMLTVNKLIAIVCGKGRFSLAGDLMLHFKENLFSDLVEQTIYEENYSRLQTVLDELKQTQETGLLSELSDILHLHENRMGDNRGKKEQEVNNEERQTMDDKIRKNNFSREDSGIFVSRNRANSLESSVNMDDYLKIIQRVKSSKVEVDTVSIDSMSSSDSAKISIEQGLKSKALKGVSKAHSTLKGFQNKIKGTFHRKDSLGEKSEIDPKVLCDAEKIVEDYQMKQECETVKNSVPLKRGYSLDSLNNTSVLYHEVTFIQNEDIAPEYAKPLDIKRSLSTVSMPNARKKTTVVTFEQPESGKKKSKSREGKARRESKSSDQRVYVNSLTECVADSEVDIEERMKGRVAEISNGCEKENNLNQSDIVCGIGKPQGNDIGKNIRHNIALDQDENDIETNNRVNSIKIENVDRDNIDSNVDAIEDENISDEAEGDSEILRNDFKIGENVTIELDDKNLNEVRTLLNKSESDTCSDLVINISTPDRKLSQYTNVFSDTSNVACRIDIPSDPSTQISTSMNTEATNQPSILEPQENCSDNPIVGNNDKSIIQSDQDSASQGHPTTEGISKAEDSCSKNVPADDIPVESMAVNSDIRLEGEGPQTMLKRASINSLLSVKQRLLSVSIKAKDLVQTIKDTKDRLTHKELISSLGDLKQNTDVIKPLDVAIKPHGDVIQPHGDVIQPHGDVKQPHDNAIQPHDNVIQPHNDVIQPQDDLITHNDVQDNELCEMRLERIEKATSEAIKQLSLSDVSKEKVLRIWLTRFDDELITFRNETNGNIIESESNTKPDGVESLSENHREQSESETVGISSQKNETVTANDDLKECVSENNSKLSILDTNENENLIGSSLETNLELKSTKYVDLSEYVCVFDPFNMPEKLHINVTILTTMCLNELVFGYDNNDTISKNENEPFLQEIKNQGGPWKTECRSSKFGTSSLEKVSFLQSHFFCLAFETAHKLIVQMTDTKQRQQLWKTLKECIIVQMLAYEGAGLFNMYESHDHILTAAKKSFYQTILLFQNNATPPLFTIPSSLLSVHPLDVYYTLLDEAVSLSAPLVYFVVKMYRHYEQDKNRFDWLSEFSNDEEIYRAVFTSFLTECKPSMSLHCSCNIMPRRWAHLLPWKHNDIIELLLRQHEHLNSFKQSQCLQHGFWLGMLSLLDSSNSRGRLQMSSLALHLDDLRLLSDHVTYHMTDKDWMVLLEMKCCLHNSPKLIYETANTDNLLTNDTSLHDTKEVNYDFDKNRLDDVFQKDRLDNVCDTIDDAFLQSSHDRRLDKSSENNRLDKSTSLVTNDDERSFTGDPLIERLKRMQTGVYDNFEDISDDDCPVFDLTKTAYSAKTESICSKPLKPELTLQINELQNNGLHGDKNFTPKPNAQIHSEKNTRAHCDNLFTSERSCLHCQQTLPSCDIKFIKPDILRLENIYKPNFSQKDVSFMRSNGIFQTNSISPSNQNNTDIGCFDENKDVECMETKLKAISIHDKFLYSKMQETVGNDKILEILMGKGDRNASGENHVSWKFCVNLVQHELHAYRRSKQQQTLILSIHRRLQEQHDLP